MIYTSKHIILPDNVAMCLYTYLSSKSINCYFTVADELNCNVYYNDTANSTVEKMVNEWLSMNEEDRVIIEEP